MTNQLRTILRDVRIDAAQYHRNTDASFRKCPYCSAVWSKIEGCDGTTQCGARPSSWTDNWSGNMSSFKFENNDGSNNLKITRIARQQESNVNRKNAQLASRGYGCGQTISWSNMAPVELPNESSFTAAFQSTNDIEVVPESAKDHWNAIFKAEMEKLKPL